MRTAAHIITSHNPKHETCRASGYGDSATETTIETGGRLMEIRVTRDGKSQFGITIQKDGSLIITDYDHHNYQTYVPQNFTLVPQRPWK